MTQRALWVALLIGLGVVYWKYNPAEFSAFPRCPFFVLTGWKCAGCGSQRALHALLNADVATAWAMNPLLVLSLPYVLLGLYFEYLGGKHRFPQWRNTLFGQRTIWFWFWLLIGYAVARNVWHF